MRHVIVTRGVYAKRIILMEDSVADTAVADGWSVERKDFVPPDDLTDLTQQPEPPQLLIDFEAAIDRGKTSIDKPVGGTGGGPAGLTLTSTVPAELVFNMFGNSLTCIGTGFDETCIVMQESNPAETTFVSDTQLDCTVWLAEDSTSTSVAVQKGSETSSALTIPVVTEEPAPDEPLVVTSLSLSVLTVGSPDTPLSVVGTGFDDRCTVQMITYDQPTTFVSATQLDTVVPASFMIQEGSIPVRVRKPLQPMSNTVDIQVTFTFT